MPPRFVPQLPLPPYTYVPGKSPHPQSDPAGHSFGKHALPAPTLDNRNWSSHEAYLFGIDLFNHGYYWESHESWEAAWHGVGRSGPIADLLKGLIHCAAAGVKLREGRAVGVATHLRKAEALFLKTKAAHQACLGLRVEELATAVGAALRQPPPLCDDPPNVVRPLFDFAILPQAE